MIFLAAGPGLFGQQRPPLFTNRSNQTEPVDTVPERTVQFELGWSVTGNGNASGRVFELPVSALHVGLNRRIEVEFLWSGVSWTDRSTFPGDGDLHGATDGAAALKMGLWNESGLRPRSAIVTGVNLPFGADDLTSRRIDPFLTFAFSHSLGEGVSLGYSLGPSWSTEEDAAGDRDTRSSLSYAISIDAGLRGSLSGFVEIFGSTALSDSGRARNSFDTGIVYNVRGRLILDASVGWGLTSESPDWFVGSGITFRIPQ